MKYFSISASGAACSWNSEQEWRDSVNGGRGGWSILLESANGEFVAKYVGENQMFFVARTMVHEEVPK